MTKICIADYGIGNILNVVRALKQVGADVELVSSPEGLKNADAIVLPGVGAFADCVAKLRSIGFDEPIKDHVAAGKPLLGICVGMQMLATVGEEFGIHDGLGLIPGKVKAISTKTIDGENLRVPHICWSSLEPTSENGWDDTILINTADDDSVYFVHSFSYHCDNPEHVLATVNYGGHELVAAVQNGNVIGTQFHPEKSGSVGLNILKSFVEKVA